MKSIPDFLRDFECSRRQDGRSGARRFAMRSNVAAICAIAICALFAGATASAAAATDSTAPVVKTRTGEVRGLVKGNVREFLGVPYAAPPVGAMRWRAPLALPSWRGVRDATKFGSSCAQMDFRGARVKGSEDCLYLNIYTPNPPGAGLPVMVWIHGGTFLVGSGSSYDGSKLAERGKLVFVAINYRLGPFGFLASPALDSGDAKHTFGNYGLLDQQAALQWVKENIAAFGGNPKNVTVAGESAGAISAGLHLVSPASAGLFERAILESGPFLHIRTATDAQQRASELESALGCAGVGQAAKCLRAISTEEILRAIPASPIGQPVWWPIVDGRLIPSQPADALAAGRFNRVAVINGSNRDEGSLFLAFGHQQSAAEFETRAKARFGANAARVLAAYPETGYVSPTQAAAAGFGDQYFSCQILRAGDLLAAKVPVYQYEFNDPHAPNHFIRNPPFPMRAFHSSEIQYVFGAAADNAGLTDAQRKLSEAMMAYWVGFITSGDPGGAPAWTKLTPSDPKILLLAPGAISYEKDFSELHHCALWDSIPR